MPFIQQIQELFDRVDKLENKSIPGLTESLIQAIKLWQESCGKQINLLETRLSELEQWTRKDEDKIYKRLEKLETHVNKLHDMINVEDRITASDVLIRLTKLESGDCFDYDQRIFELENIGTEVRLMELESPRLTTMKKIPHKCPVCDGSGSSKAHLRILVSDQMSVNGKEIKKGEKFVSSICKCCSGKGIVWG